MCSQPFQAQISMTNEHVILFLYKHSRLYLGVQSMPSLPIILTEPIGSERSPYGFKNRVQNLL